MPAPPCRRNVSPSVVLSAQHGLRVNLSASSQVTPWRLACMSRRRQAQNKRYDRDGPQLIKIDRLYCA